MLSSYSSDFLFGLVAESAFRGDRSASIVSIVQVDSDSTSETWIRIGGFLTVAATMSYELKEKGNLLFKEGDYNGAEELYSQAFVIPVNETN